MTCPKGKNVLGGGITVFTEAGLNVAIVSNGPLSNRTWTADLQEVEGSGNATFIVRAICSTVQ